ncbi:hypothetical protein BC831DRAFT_400387 [Entophlyctis helioformis]|nr:hypothetical protein BC831DRAFT_400387 [Entophlyctis helioformis]
MPPKRATSASKGGKGASAKDRKGSAGDLLIAPPDPNAIRRRELRPQYVQYCKQFVTDPLPGILKRIDEAIDQNKEIQQLIVDAACLRTNDIAAIRSTFRKYTPLYALCLWKTKFQDTAFQTTIGFVAMKQTLGSLQLVGNDLTEAHAPILASLCRESVRLKSLVLDHNHLGIGCIAILKGICENNGCILQKLSMRYCAMDSDASPFLGSIIARLPTLKSLDVGGNLIRDEGLPPISRALTETKTLSILGLAFNEIGDSAISGSLPFAEFCRLVIASPLTQIDLSGNFFGDHGMEKLLEIQRQRKVAWAAGKAPPLRLLVPERANNSVFDGIWDMNTAMTAVAGKKGKKGKKK